MPHALVNVCAALVCSLPDRGQTRYKKSRKFFCLWPIADLRFGKQVKEEHLSCAQLEPILRFANDHELFRFVEYYSP